MTNPVALTTTIWGSGSRRALLLHGLTSAASTWWRTGEALAERGFTVIAPDLRAHGRSPVGDVLSIDAYRDDVLLLGEGWDVLVGHSLGGAVAAAVLAARPQFAARAVFEDPAIDSDVTAQFLADSPEPLANPTVFAVAAEHPDWHPRDVELKVEALRACGPKVGERTMADAAPWDVWPMILNLSIPTLVVAADLAVGSLVSQSKELEVEQSAGPIDLVRIAGAGHSMHRDGFATYSSLLLEFLEA